jgi:Uma2 family endonuclease
MAVYITRKDYEQLPEGTPVELQDGMLVKQPSPRYGHQRIHGQILMALQRLLGPARAVSGPVDVLIDEINVFVPDIVVLEDVPDDEAQYVGVPRVVFEVLSPSSEQRDRDYKARRYLGLGVAEVWLVDRHARTIEIATLREGVRLFCGERVARSDILAGFALVPDELFAAP